MDDAQSPHVEERQNAACKTPCRKLIRSYSVHCTNAGKIRPQHELNSNSVFIGPCRKCESVGILIDGVDEVKIRAERALK